MYQTWAGHLTFHTLTALSHLDNPFSLRGANAVFRLSRRTLGMQHHITTAHVVLAELEAASHTSTGIGGREGVAAEVASLRAQSTDDEDNDNDNDNDNDDNGGDNDDDDEAKRNRTEAPHKPDTPPAARRHDSAVHGLRAGVNTRACAGTSTSSMNGAPTLHPRHVPVAAPRRRPSTHAAPAPRPAHRVPPHGAEGATRGHNACGATLGHAQVQPGGAQQPSPCGQRDDTPYSGTGSGLRRRGKPGLAAELLEKERTQREAVAAVRQAAMLQELAPAQGVGLGVVPRHLSTDPVQELLHVLLHVLVALYVIRCVFFVVQHR